MKTVKFYLYCKKADQPAVKLFESWDEQNAKLALSRMKRKFPEFQFLIKIKRIDYNQTLA